MPVLSRSDVGAHFAHTLFQPTVVMSSYLVGFCCGEFDFVEMTSDGGVFCRVYTTLGNADQARFALRVGARAIDFFSDFFGIKYPLPKLDQIAIPDFSAGAMENFGLVTYRESLMLVPDSDSASVAVKQDIAGESVRGELSFVTVADQF
jgi:puromycin-sensitive aminopeptidase